MTKADIVEQIYERVGFSKKESAELVEKVFEIMKDTLSDGEKVKISGFGNFVVREKNARKGRNPQTGEEIRLAARRVLTFKPSLVLKNVLNEEDARPGGSGDGSAVAPSRAGSGGSEGGSEGSSEEVRAPAGRPAEGPRASGPAPGEGGSPA